MSREPERYAVAPGITLERMRDYTTKTSEACILLYTKTCVGLGHRQPTRAQIAEAMNLSKRTVDEGVRRLLKEGVLVKTLL